VWGVARAFGGKVLLRIEDHDRVRSRPDFETQLVLDLEWLGCAADIRAPRQSDRYERYREALRELTDAGLAYACACSRKSIAGMASAAAGELRYPGTCRKLRLDGATHQARRIALDPVSVTFRDLRLGPIEQVPAELSGDILGRDRHGHWTYQFAVTVDDLDQGIDLVIRGEDILPSTGRQIQVARLLGRETPPRYLHHPLITRQDGVKLSKANRDTGIRDLRASGWSAERVLGEAAKALGLGTGAPLDWDAITAAIRDTVGR